MSKPKSISEEDIYVSSERDHSGNHSSDYRYNIWFYGEYIMNDITPDDAREIIACLQHALAETEPRTTK